MINLENCTVKNAICILQSLPKNQKFSVSICVEKITENQEEDFLEKIKNLIQNNQPISHRCLQQKINSSKRSDLEIAIKRLLDLSQITFDLKKASNGKPVRFYKIS